MGWQFYLDRGGTFTDLIGISPKGQLVIRKILSVQTNHDEDPAIRAIKEVLEIKDKNPIPNGIIKEVKIGTTVATNALLENNGNSNPGKPSSELK